jgi:hypothetical protein
LPLENVVQFLFYELRGVPPTMARGRGRTENYLRVIDFEFKVQINISLSISQFLSVAIVFHVSTQFLQSNIRILFHTRVYPKVSGLAVWSENCKLYSSLPLGALVSLFYESVQ